MTTFKKYLSETTAEQAFTSQGKATVRPRQTNPRFGDNAMLDPTKKLDELDQTSVLDRLEKMLTKAGASEDEIKAGVNLTQTGMQKAAAALGIGPADIPMLLASLSTRLRHDDHGVEDAYESFIRRRGKRSTKSRSSAHRMIARRIAEDDRFSVEDDYLDNVTVRDSETGKEAYLQGSEAEELLLKIQNNPEDEQTILAGYQHLMEEDNFDADIDDSNGSYNFPWKVDDQHGLATVIFSEKNGKPHLDLSSVRDEDGEEIETEADMEDSILVQAREFIGKE